MSTTEDQTATARAVLDSLAGLPTPPGPTVGTASAPRTGPPPGFGLAVNDYLNHYVSVADAKAAGLMAAALAVGSAVTGLHPTDWVEFSLQWLAIVLLAGALIAGATAIYPRLPSGHQRGLIFWEDVRAWPSASDYQRALSEVDETTVEMEYAGQNHVVSHVLHTKHAAVRVTIRLFLFGVGAALAAWIAVPRA